MSHTGIVCLFLWIIEIIYCAISVSPSVSTIQVTYGDFVSISMTVLPTSPPVTGYWVKQGLDGMDATIVIDNVKFIAPSTETLILMNFVHSDTGFYTLHVSNGVTSGYSEQPTLVVLTGSPTVSSSVTEINEAPTGQTIVIPCTYLPSDPNNIIRVGWLHIDMSNNSRYVNSSETSKYSGSTAIIPSLSILNFDLTDLGYYWCQVENSHGTGTCSKISLNLPSGFTDITISETLATSEVTEDISTSRTVVLGDMSTSGTSVAGDMTTSGISSSNTSCISHRSETKALYTRYSSRHSNVGLLFTSYEKSNIKCALNCLQHHSCTGFNYQETTGTCQLTQSAITDLINNNNWNHYLECI